MRRLHLPAALLATLGSLPAFAQTPPPAKPYAPVIAGPSAEGERAIRRIRVAPPLQVSLFAAEPLLANPVCFAIDHRNRFYVVETFRLHAGVTDIRGHMDWLDDDLASRTVADRLAVYRKHLKEKYDTYGIDHDRVRLIEDTTGAGKADRATVFADGFHLPEQGLAAGIATRGGNVWLTCIPDLWLLRDTRGAGRADVRRRLQTGYGVHVGFIGHDLHGLRLGPDGKLYFSIGDRGLHVEQPGRTVDCRDSGAVLRCNPDGSDLEVFATGLRNPQELAFDQYGNLFTGDNNADHGDKARCVYVVEGGDSGWRIGYQFLTEPMDLGPWNLERLWQPQWDGQAAYIIPPVANVADGPSGLAYEPGTSQLPARYRDHFFLCDFRGGSGTSGVRSFAVRPKGAGFEMVDQHQFVWSVLATDCDFGTDGALYVSDWVEGWNLPHKGRLYKVHDPARAGDAVRAATRKLLADGMAQRPAAELAGLLAHADLRVRQEAQFTLAERGDRVTLTAVARAGKSRLARLHGIWGLGQVGRKEPAALAPVVELLADRDAEVRAQAAKVAGDARATAAADRLPALLRDPEPRVRFFAALAVGKLRANAAVGPVLDMVRENADRDPYLRHAGVMALAGIGDLAALHAAAADGSPAVRTAVLLAYRRLRSPEVGRFLDDPEPRLAAEAARAINDVPIEACLPRLAAVTPRAGMPEPLLFRIVNANFRLGGSANARAVAALTGLADVPAAVRIEALRALADWAKPSGRDRVVGLWRPLAPRSGDVAAGALRESLAGIFTGPVRVRQEAARVAARLGVKDVGPLLADLAADPKQPARLRVEMLKALDVLRDRRLPQVTRQALADPDAHVRAEGRHVLARLDPAAALPALEAVLEQGERVERQAAFATLGTTTGPAADAILARWLDRLLAGHVPAELHLDLLDAARARRAADVKQRLARYEAARPKGDPLAAYREALAGGDAEAGRRIFFTKAEVACVRCHRVAGVGGEVGPDLSDVGKREKRPYLLESIVDPNRQIAKGFNTAVLALTDGRVVAGVLKSEDAREVRLMTAEAKLLVIPKADIEERSRGKSAMPEDTIKSLSKSELRDLVEFLSTLRTPPGAASGP